MKVGSTHLTYCTNIHAGEGWLDVFENLRTHLCAVRASIAPELPFGIGLRLSAEAAATLREPAVLAQLRGFLTEHDLYVFTINGFPYGRFHGEPVKARVYQPDWTRRERGDYTKALIEILATLLPDGVAGSISTVPGGFRSDITAPEQAELIAGQLLEQVAALASVERSSGRHIALALEPEPACFIETTAELVRFFEAHLLSARARAGLARELAISGAAAEALIRRHLGICLDACHAAVEFETPAESLAALSAAGIRIAKVQASAGLRIPEVNAQALEALSAYDEMVYLHQVVARTHTGELLRFVDLPEAFQSEQARAASEWRVHFHVPLYREALGAFSNTQAYLSDLLALQRRAPFTSQIEVETYTWDVLPAEQRSAGLVPSIARELAWVRERLVS
ncbi:MAG TPA: metabolite traffic protein EboE [Polyangiaceae bacterium]|nr:metabolite traffic protein EboE [Polyangiaceae bacterium]